MWDYRALGLDPGFLTPKKIKIMLENPEKWPKFGKCDPKNPKNENNFSLNTLNELQLFFLANVFEHFESTNVLTKIMYGMFNITLIVHDFQNKQK